MACIGIVRQNELETGREALWVLFWPPKTVPVFVDQWSGKEWHGNGIRMRTH